ncbi:Ras-related protein Rab-7b [Lamellibrachia satsuma]|nr:Ras-related protein Rab-7b [Lamellibrachia satsuma]
MATSRPPKKRADLKVVILGASDVGKTALIHRYIEGTFKKEANTIGASFSLRQWGQYNIAIWDTAGEEKFCGLSAFYCRGAGAAIFAYDVTNEDSFHALRARFKTLLQDANKDCLVVVVGTKLDLLSSQAREVSQDDALVLARELNTGSLKQLPYFETSSLTGQNIVKVFEYIFTEKLSQQTLEDQSVRHSTVDLRSGRGSSTSSKCGC